MIPLTPATRIHPAVGPTDLRKAFDGLSVFVRESIEEDPLSGHLFVFCSRSRNRIKILLWDGSGLWVLAKPLPENLPRIRVGHALSETEIRCPGCGKDRV